MQRTALITGVAGQDGSYLAELLLDRGYRVIGTATSFMEERLQRIASIRTRLELVSVDLLSQRSIEAVLEQYRPQEFYNLAARASSRHLFEDPVLTGELNGLAVARILESIRKVDQSIRFCQASSSEMFGKARECPQNESTPFYPRNPYGVAKQYAHWMAVNYRETYGLFACSAILFNHESPRRDPHFVTRKVTSAAARIKLGLQSELELESLHAERDWGYAGDYMRGMWQMLQIQQPDDYVLATGETHSVSDLCDTAFGAVGLDYRDFVRVSERAARNHDGHPLRGDPSKAERRLGWKREIGFARLIRMMVEADLSTVQNERPTDTV